METLEKSYNLSIESLLTESRKGMSITVNIFVNEIQDVGDLGENSVVGDMFEQFFCSLSESQA